MLWVPPVSVEVLNVATPLPLTLTGPPMIVVPSLNVTVPVGVPPEPLTVAVKVTDWLKVEEVGDGATVVVVALKTVSVRLSLLAPKLVLPTKLDTTENVPPTPNVVVKVATPEPLRARVTGVPPLMMKLTLPD